MLPGEWRLSKGGSVCAASGIGIKTNLMKSDYPKGGDYSGEGRGLFGALSPLYHVKFEVSRFSRFGDIKGVQKFKTRLRDHAPTQCDLIDIFMVRAPNPL